MDEISNKHVVTDIFGDAGVEGVIRSAHAESGERLSLELIAEAQDGILSFGNWTIDEYENASGELKQRTGDAVGQIRLLGCLTAMTRRGQAAMQHLANVFDVRVFGATTTLDSSDFDGDGIKSDHDLRSDHNCPPLADDQSTISAQWFSKLVHIDLHLHDLMISIRDESLASALAGARSHQGMRWPVLKCTAQDLLDLLGSLEDRAAMTRGLLALPDYEMIFPSRSLGVGARYRRATVLCGGQFVRLYRANAGDGVLFRAKRTLEISDWGALLPI